MTNIGQTRKFMSRVNKNINLNYSNSEISTHIEGMSDVEYILWIEKRFGPLTKTVGNNPSNEDIKNVEIQITDLLYKYKNELKISIPIPKVRMWLKGDKINFLFFEKYSDRRILLGDWLSNRLTYYGH